MLILLCAECAKCKIFTRRKCIVDLPSIFCSKHPAVHLQKPTETLRITFHQPACMQDGHGHVQLTVNDAAPQGSLSVDGDSENPGDSLVGRFPHLT